jgi:hypothetical protein
MADAPRPTELDPRDLTSFAEAGTLAVRFEVTLRQYGITIASGSDLESVNLDLMMLEGLRAGQGRPHPMTDIRPMFGRAAGWIDFVKLLLRAHQEAKFDRILAHLHLLNTARAVAQNERVPMSDEASNKLFELFIALTCSPFSQSVTLDDPHQARGDNPDVLAVVDGVRWGFACKVMNGVSPITMYERLEEGLDQIECSPADTGFVFFNFKNQIDHRRTWPLLNEDAYRLGAEEPLYGSWPDPRPVEGELTDFMNARWEECYEVNGRENLVRLFTGKKSMPGAAAYMATGTAFRGSTGPVPSIVGQIGVMQATQVPEAGYAVLSRMNDVVHGRA